MSMASDLDLSAPLTASEKAVVDSLSHVSSALVELAEHHDENMSWPYSESGMAKLAAKMAAAMAVAAGDPGLLRPRINEHLLKGLIEYRKKLKDEQEAENIEEFVGWLRRALAGAASTGDEPAVPSQGFVLIVRDENGDELGVTGPFPTQKEAEKHWKGLPHTDDCFPVYQPCLPPSDPSLADRLQEFEAPF